MMPLRFAAGLVLVVSLFAATAWPAQAPPADDTPTEHRPLRPRTPAELARREAQVLYGLGVLRRQNDCLLEAVRLFEEALTRDADAMPARKALAALYAALGRPRDALAAYETVLKHVPDDHETWQAYAHLLKVQGRLPDARTALRRAAACPALAEFADLWVQVHHDLGGLHEDLREYDQAVAALTAVAQFLEDPEKLRELDNPPEARHVQEQAAGTHERIIRLWIAAGRHDRAVAAFQQTVGKYPELATRLNLPLARVHVALNQHAEALVRLDDYLRTQPVSTEGYELKAAVLEQLGRGAEVLPALEACARRDEHNLALQLLVARQCTCVGQAERAEALYQALLEKHAPQPEIYQGLFALYRGQGRLEKVLFLLDATLARAVKRDDFPGDAAAALRGRNMLTVLREDAELARALAPAALGLLDTGRTLHADTCFFLGTLAARAKQLPAAERLYRRCLEGELNAQTEAAVHDGLLRVLWEQKKYEAIAWLCERGLRQATGASRLLFHLNHARALVLLGQVDAGLAEAERAVAAAPDDDARFVARLTRLRVLVHAERYDQALADGQTLVQQRLAPGQLRDVRYLLSGIYSALRDYAKSEAQLQLVLKNDPNDATACNDLGYLWADQGKDLEEAERLIRKALDLDREQKKAAGAEAEPDNAAFADSLGWVLFRRGDLAGARTWLEKAATLPGGADDPVVWDHLGDVYSRLGDSARAAAAWRKSLDLYEKDRRRKADDRSPEVRRKLQQLGTQP